MTFTVINPTNNAIQATGETLLDAALSIAKQLGDSEVCEESLAACHADPDAWLIGNGWTWKTSSTASLNPEIADFCADNDMSVPDNAEFANEIWDAADEYGYIQAEQMVDLFPGQPELHTTTRLRHALVRA